MHTPCEVVSLNDLDAAADLLAHFVAGVEAADDFIPFRSGKSRRTTAAAAKRGGKGGRGGARGGGGKRR